MKYYITIDGGTTNTRVSLVKDMNVLDTVKIPLGARMGMDGTEPLKGAIKSALSSLLEKFKLTEDHIVRILASGMITSEFGLCPLSHLIAPAGIAELHASMHETVIPDITQIPFVFIRGIKIADQSLSKTDMMRGEETELYGLSEVCNGDALYVLPGSHSKLIETDTCGRITRFSTMLTGEMIASLAEGTILKDAVDLSVTRINDAFLLHGCQYAMQKGLNEALFKVRILKNVFDSDVFECYSFFLGAVLAGEVKAILDAPQESIVIGGKSQIKRATEQLLHAMSSKKITVADDLSVDASSALGAIRIFEY